MVDEPRSVVSAGWVAASDSPSLDRPAWDDGQHALSRLPVVADPAEMDLGRGDQYGIELVRKNFHLDQRHRLERVEGAPDESGAKRREQGLAKAGNARVRRGMIPLAWRFLR